MKKSKMVIGSAVVVAALIVSFLLYQSGILGAMFAPQAHAKEAQAKGQDDDDEGKPVLVNVAGDWFAKKNTDAGLKLTDETIKGLNLTTAEVTAPQTRRLPPQIGTLNYDMETMFLIKPRFTGELATMLKVKDKIVDENGYEKIVERPIKFGDRVKQGTVLAVFWSQTLGVAKAALVDAICSLRLSTETRDRQKKLRDEGALPESTYKQSERQVQADSLAVLTAERTLRMWKLTDAEIKGIKDEANTIHDTKVVRDAAKEAEKWSRVEVTVPWFDKAHKDREVTILEKNTQLGDMVDPANYGMPLFRVADMSRLQIWVHPPEEMLTMIRDGMKKNGGMLWEIRFQSDPDVKHTLRVDRISPSLEPNQHNPMVIGYLPNEDHRYLVGQFVTATFFMPPDADTLEVPTDALNELKGQSFVFVKGKEKGEYFIRRVAVLRRYADYSVVRSKLRKEDEQFSADEVKQGRYPLRTLARGEEVVTRGVVELTTALENSLIKESIKLKQKNP